MMQIIPAIDIYEGGCVRLKKGDFASVTHYNIDPVELVKSFLMAGLSLVHCVDLEGARLRKPVNLGVLKKLLASEKIQIEWGGGLATLDAIETILGLGAHRVIIGSAAVTNPGLVKKLLEKYGKEKIVLGADVKEDKIAIHGWMEASDSTLIQFIESWLACGAKYFLCTDVSRDGLLEGPSVGLYRRVKLQFPEAYIIASGGVSCYQDLIALEAAGADAAIVGKAFYEGKITLDELKKFTENAR